MPTKKQKVEVFREGYICDKCNVGTLEPFPLERWNHLAVSYNSSMDGKVFSLMWCSVCETQTLVKQSYPIITYEPVGSPTTQVEQPEPVVLSDRDFDAIYGEIKKVSAVEILPIIDYAKLCMREAIKFDRARRK